MLRPTELKRWCEVHIQSLRGWGEGLEISIQHVDAFCYFGKGKRDLLTNREFFNYKVERVLADDWLSPSDLEESSLTGEARLCLTLHVVCHCKVLPQQAAFSSQSYHLRWPDGSAFCFDQAPASQCSF